MAKSPKRHGLVTRPIVREVWSEQADAANLMALDQRGKFSLGRQETRQRFSAAGAGNQIGFGLGGGTYEPATNPQS